MAADQGPSAALRGRRPALFLTRRLPAAAEARLAGDYDLALNEGDRPLDRSAILKGLSGCDGLITTVGDPIDAALIEALPDRVRVIATVSVGTDHIDTAAAAARGIAVTNTPDVLTDATAEIALLLMLAAARRAGEGIGVMRRRAWPGWSPTYMMGKQLTGRSLGLYGMGRIGRAVAARARAFGMEIHYHNRRRLPPEAEAGAQYHETLAALLRVSEVLSIHCASTDETRGSIDMQALARLPDEAILVNTARGDIVDDAAVIAALRSGRLYAAGLDVFAGEPDFELGYLDCPRAVLLPHLGSATVETRTAMGMRAADNLDAFFRGSPVPDPVTA